MGKKNAVYSLHDCLRGVRDEGFEKAFDRWRSKGPDEAAWRRAWESSSVPSALIHVYAWSAQRRELIGVLVHCAAPLVSGRGAIVELEPALVAAKAFSLGLLEAAALDGELDSLCHAMSGQTSRSSRRRHAKAAGEALLRAAITTDMAGKVGYRHYARSVVDHVVLASSTAANREEHWAKMCARIRSVAECPAIDAVIRAVEREARG